MSKQFTLAEASRLHLDFLVNDPARLGDAFLTVTESGEDNEGIGIKTLLEACKERGVDPMPALNSALTRLDNFRKLIAGDKPLKVSSRGFRMPMSFPSPAERT